jgi:hypothetical protein
MTQNTEGISSLEDVIQIPHIISTHTFLDITHVTPTLIYTQLMGQLTGILGK